MGGGGTVAEDPPLGQWPPPIYAPGPFFDKYPLSGVKALDYADFRKTADIIRVKGHFTEEGLLPILHLHHCSGVGRGGGFGFMGLDLGLGL